MKKPQATISTRREIAKHIELQRRGIPNRDRERDYSYALSAFFLTVAVAGMWVLS